MNTPDTSPSPLALISQRVLTIGEIVSATWSIYTKHFVVILIITLIVAIPVNIGNSLIQNATQPAVDCSNNPEACLTDGVGLGSIPWMQIGGASLLLSLVGILSPLAIAFGVKKLIDGEPVTSQQALKAAITAWPRGILTSILMVIFLVGLYFLFFIPGVIFTIFWAFAIQAVMLDNRTGTGALSASKHAVQGRWWKVFGNLLIIGIAVGFFSWVITTPFGDPDAWILRALVSTISSVVTVLANIALAVMYINLKKFPPITPAPPVEQPKV